MLAHLLCALTLAAAPARLNDALLDAARNDDPAAAATLIRQGADVNAREADGATPLAWAVIRGNVDLATQLLKAGANPNLANELGIGPLSLAITNQFPALVRLLLEKGADPNVARENGETPLMTAARTGQVDVMKLLLARDAQVNVREKKFGQTALMWAAGNPGAVSLLLEHHADIRPVTSSWDVKYTIYAPTTVTLGKTGIPWNTDGEFTTRKGGQNALFFAVHKHDIESARLLIDAGIDVNAPSADGTTPLLASLYQWDPPKKTFVPGVGAPAQAGSSQRFAADPAMARFLLERGAKVAVADGTGYTPLHGAALAVAAKSASGGRRRGAYGNSAAVLALSGEQDKEAAARGLQDALAIVRQLLEAGADPNRQTLYPTAGPAGDVRINPSPPGSSPFHIAGSSSNVELVKLLAARGANPNLVRKDGHTPFSVAVLAGDLPVIQEMAASGANIQAIYSPLDKIPDPVEPITLARQNQTILHIAAIEGSPAVIEYLYSKGARLDVKNSLGETPLDLADKQERYREAIQIQAAEGDAAQIAKVKRQTAGSDAFKKLAR